MATHSPASSASAGPTADEDHYGSYVARALATDGGHLAIGAYGFTL